MPRKKQKQVHPLVRQTRRGFFGRSPKPYGKLPRKKYKDPLDVAGTMNPIKLFRRWQRKHREKLQKPK